MSISPLPLSFGRLAANDQVHFGPGKGQNFRLTHSFTQLSEFWGEMEWVVP